LRLSEGLRPWHSSGRAARRDYGPLSLNLRADSRTYAIIVTRTTYLGMSTSGVT
jgi:hypothetical protein